MVDYIVPPQSPMPRAAQGYDGTDFITIRVSPAGYMTPFSLWTGVLWVPWSGTVAGRGRVRGEDQLFSIKDTHRAIYSYVMPGAGDYSLMGLHPPVDEVWVITSILAINYTGPSTSIRIGVAEPGLPTYCGLVVAPAALVPAVYSGWLPVLNIGQVFATFTGVAAGDTLSLDVHGFEMTLEV